MKRMVWQWAMLAVVLLHAGCATRPREGTAPTAGGPVATCHVCRYNNDLACLEVRVKDTTPRMDYQGETYCFCSEYCRAVFAKNPQKYLPKP